MAVLYNVYRLRALNEWAIRVRDGRVEIREGTRGARATYEAIPDDECAGGDPEEDMARRVRERVAAGYLHYGTGDFPNDRLRRVGRADPERLALYWSPCAPVSHDAFDTVAAYLAELFGRFGARAQATRIDASGALALIVSTDGGRWGVRLNRHSRLHDRLNIAPPRVRRDHGTLPVLALRYLQTRFPRALALSYDPQHRPDEAPPQPRLSPHDYWLGEDVAPYEDTLRIGEALGMEPVELRSPGTLPGALPLAVHGSAPPRLWF